MTLGADSRVLVVGIGAIGAWLLARFTEHGADVTGLARGATYDLLSNGEPLVLESPDGDWSGEVQVVDQPDGDYDLVVLCVKSQDTASIAAGLPLGATILSAQNGVGNVEPLREHHDDVRGCVVYCGCERLGTTRVRNEFANSRLVVDDADLASWLSEHGVPTEVTDDIVAAQWRKLIINVVGNGLSAILRTRFGSIFTVPEIEPVMRAALAEGVAVARADGADLGEADIEAAVSMFRSMPADKTTSTLQDLEAGRPLEVELTGVVVRKATEHGIDVPTVRTIDAMLRVISPS